MEIAKKKDFWLRTRMERSWKKKNNINVRGFRKQLWKALCIVDHFVINRLMSKAFDSEAKLLDLNQSDLMISSVQKLSASGEPASTNLDKTVYLKLA